MSTPSPAALERRYANYAGRYVAEQRSTLDLDWDDPVPYPTDERMAAAFAQCARRAKVEEYPEIRARLIIEYRLVDRDVQRALDAAASLGHTVESDPPFMSAAQRWTCTSCGAAVLLYGRNVYGSATENICQGA